MNSVSLPYLGRILLVEDIDDSRFMLRRLLELEGFDVVEANDGDLALEMLRKHSCDVVLLDLRMPNLDGIKFTRALRQTIQFQNLPIIITSALDDEQSRRAAAAAGCNAYMTKPLDVELLLSLLKKYLAPTIGPGH